VSSKVWEVQLARLELPTAMAPPLAEKKGAELGWSIATGADHTRKHACSARNSF